MALLGSFNIIMTKRNVIGVSGTNGRNPKTLKKRYLQGVVLIAGLGIGIRHWL